MASTVAVEDSVRSETCPECGRSTARRLSVSRAAWRLGLYASVAGVVWMALNGVLYVGGLPTLALNGGLFAVVGGLLSLVVGRVAA